MSADSAAEYPHVANSKIATSSTPTEAEPGALIFMVRSKERLEYERGQRLRAMTEGASGTGSSRGARQTGKAQGTGQHRCGGTAQRRLTKVIILL
jgi:hypothetical protein